MIISKEDAILGELHHYIEIAFKIAKCLLKTVQSKGVMHLHRKSAISYDDFFGNVLEQANMLRTPIH